MKKQVKKGMAVLCAAAIMFTVAACGKADTGNVTTGGNTEAGGQEQTESSMATEPAPAVTDEKVSAAEEFTFAEENGELTITGYTGSANIINVPDSIEGKPVTAIGENAFINNTDITEVVLPDSVLVIEKAAFQQCSNLTTVKLGNNVQEIKTKAFWMTSLEAIEIPDTQTVLGAMVFGHTNLKEIIIPASVTEIGEGAFVCTGIENITVPGTVKTIGYQAFAGCENLKEAVIEEGVEFVDDSAFADCTMLESIYFPMSATEVNEYAVMHSGPDEGKLKIFVPQGSVAEAVFVEKYANNEYFEVIVQ